MADTMKTNEAKVSIKVIVDKVRKKVVYAEADHTFVDILFSFMTLPLGAIARLLGELDDTKLEACKSLNNLYQSLKDFPERCLWSEECRLLLLNPRSLSFDHCRELKLKLDDTEPLSYFGCLYCYNKSGTNSHILSSYPGAICRTCGFRPMNMSFGYNKPDDCVDGGGVFVSDAATFIVTDDLCVMPFTSASCIRLLTESGISDKSRLKEIKLDIGREQMLFLLKLALSLDSVLTCLVFQTSSSIQNIVLTTESTILDVSTSPGKDETSSSKIQIEVSLQKSTGKLLFAESKEDFVEFLFGFLSIPLGTVVGELIKEKSVSCMDNIFKSITNMSIGSYLKSQGIKDMLLKPHIGQRYLSKYKVFPLVGTPIPPNLHHDKDPRIDGGLLKQSGMFIVTDDLIISPSSSFSTLSTLEDLKVSFDDIQKYQITIGLREGLKMLKAALSSSSTLSESLEH